MVIELKLTFKDEVGEIAGPIEFIHTLSAPADMEITGGQLFVENPQTSELERFSFRIDRDETGKAQLTILENVNA